MPFFVALVLFLLLLLAFWIVFRWRQRHPLVESPFGDVAVRMAQVGDFRIRYHISGKGPPLVLIHGIGADLFCWRHFIPFVNRKFTTVALDLPGFGQSSKPARAHYGLDEQVERVHGFLRDLGIHEAYIVGSSMGGNIALWYALTYPKDVLGLAVIAPATSPELVPINARSLAWLAKPMSMLVTRRAMRWAHRRAVSRKDAIDRDRVEATFKTYDGNHEAVRSFLLATEAIRDPRLRSRLPELNVPVLVLWGSEDLLVPRQVIEALESALAAPESAVHTGGGHHLQEDDPEWVAEKIDGFFAKIQD